jgi:branched-chain amino acid transport system permease protein
MPDSIVTILDVLIGGLLLGGLYALIAMGFSLQYGVARVLNIAHGEFIMLSAFLTWTLYTYAHINPLLSLVIVGPFIFVLGYIFQRTLFTKLRTSSPNQGAFEASSMLATFGLMFILQNAALLIWGGNYHGYAYLATPVSLGGAIFPANSLLALGIAVIIGVIFYIFVARTRMGKAIRAAAQDSTTAGLMGVDINQMLAICFGLGALMASFAGLLYSMCYSVYATMGLEKTVVAIIVVVLGGLGSITGSFIGGFMLGIIGNIVTYFEPGLTMPAYYLIFTLLLLIRPKGIMGR